MLKSRRLFSELFSAIVSACLDTLKAGLSSNSGDVYYVLKFDAVHNLLPMVSKLLKKCLVNSDWFAR